MKTARFQLTEVRGSGPWGLGVGQGRVADVDRNAGVEVAPDVEAGRLTGLGHRGAGARGRGRDRRPGDVGSPTVRHGHRQRRAVVRLAVVDVHPGDLRVEDPPWRLALLTAGVPVVVALLVLL